MVMTKDEILEGIRQLSMSQGYYSRMYEALMNAPEEQRDCFLSHIEETNPTDMVDVVTYLEG